MNSPAAPKPGTLRFDSIVVQSGHVLREQRRTVYHALQIGVNPDEILDYARGLLPDDFEELLVQCSWAMNRVVALTRAKRRPASLGAKLLTSIGRTDPYVWGIRDTGDRERDMASLLDQVT